MIFSPKKYTQIFKTISATMFFCSTKNKPFMLKPIIHHKRSRCAVHINPLLIKETNHTTTIHNDTRQKLAYNLKLSPCSILLFTTHNTLANSAIMSLLDGLLASEAWLSGEDTTASPIGINLGNPGSEFSNLFQLDEEIESLTSTSIPPTSSSTTTPKHNMKSSSNPNPNNNQQEQKCNKSSQPLCLPPNHELLRPILRMPREKKWVADWVFKVPVLQGGMAVSPEMFGYAMACEIEEEFLEVTGEGFGKHILVDEELKKEKHIKTMNVPVSTINGFTIGYSFCVIKEYNCPLDIMKKELLGCGDTKKLDEQNVYFGRFVFEAKKKEMLIVCPLLDEGTTQMIWIKEGLGNCPKGLPLGWTKRFRAMVCVPGNAEYGWSNLPKQLLVANVFEEFKDPTFKPNIDFARFAKADHERAASPFSDCTTSSTSQDLMFDKDNGTKVMSAVTSGLSTDGSGGVFDFNVMMEALGEIEKLSKGRFNSPITITDMYDPLSGRLLYRKTQNFNIRMDRISSPDADIQFRTSVAQAYYAKYYSPVFDLPLLPGAKEIMLASSNASSPAQSTSPIVPPVAVSPVSVSAATSIEQPLAPAATKIPGPAKRIRKAAKLAPRPVPVEELSSNDDDSTEDKEEKARKMKEAKAYAKKIRNRESAARSNARRRKHIEAVRKELAEVTSQKELLAKRKEEMMKENARMKASLVNKFSSELA